MEYTVTIGLVPVRRNMPGPKRTGIFNPDCAIANKERLCPYIRDVFGRGHVRFVDIDFLNSDGLLYDEKDVDQVFDFFSREKVDALFIINCNFGNEEAAGLLARRMGKPVLIWAPQDEIFEPDGTRYTDAQCGLFAVSKYLQRAGVPFSHIKNCRVGDPAFSEGLERFISVACMVKNFRGLRIAQVGTRPKPFTSVIVNEGELFSLFDIQVIPVNMGSVIERHARIMERMDGALARDAAEFATRYRTGGVGTEQLKKMLAFKYVYREIMEEYQCDLISTECWTAMPAAVGCFPCCAMSELADEGIIVTCESDLHGAITMALLAAGSLGKKIPFFLEMTVRHPGEDDVELLWHCGPAAYSLKKEDSDAHLDNTRCGFELKHGTYTMAQMGMREGRYSLFAAALRSADGPYTFGNYIWARFPDLDALEKKIIEGPYIHHMAEIEGDCLAVLREFTKYIPHLAFDAL